MKTANMSFAVMALLYSASATEVQQMSALESTSSLDMKGWCNMSAVQRRAWVKSQRVELRAVFTRERANLKKIIKGALAQYKEARNEILAGYKATRTKIITEFRAAIKGQPKEERKAMITAFRKDLTDRRNAMKAQFKTLRDRFMVNRKSFIDSYKRMVKSQNAEFIEQVKRFKKTEAECEAYQSSSEEEPETETEEKTESEKTEEETESEKTEEETESEKTASEATASEATASEATASEATASEESEATASEESEDEVCVAPKVFGNTCDRAVQRILHEQKACLWKNNGAKMTPYVDVGFPADKTSANIGAWKRPSEMDSNPSLWGSKGVRPAAVQQGKLGDCWWLAAAAALAEGDDGARVKAIITNKNEATGIYEFKFFRNGNFEKVIIDDRLPVRNANSNRTEYAHKSTNGAWWVPLMEKAAAKFYGRYSNLAYGNGQEGWEMLTGMPSRSYVPSNEGDLQKILDEADEGGHVMNANVNRTGCTNNRKNGLPCGHAYTLLEHVTWKNGDYVKIRNPWGNTEWNGALSDKDTSATAKAFFADHAHPNANDGTFWMGMADFKVNFYEVVVGDFLEGWKYSSKPVESKRDRKSVLAWSFGFTNPVAQAVSIGLIGNNDRNFMDWTCLHEDKIGSSWKDKHYFHIVNSSYKTQTAKDGKLNKFFYGFSSDSYLRYDNLAAGTYAIQGNTGYQSMSYNAAGTLHFAANAWAQKQAIVFN